MFKEIRPNMLVGMLILAALCGLSMKTMSEQHAKEITLLVTGGIIGTMTDLLGLDKNRKRKDDDQ